MNKRRIVANELLRIAKQVEAAPPPLQKVTKHLSVGQTISPQNLQTIQSHLQNVQGAYHQLLSHCNGQTKHLHEAFQSALAESKDFYKDFHENTLGTSPSWSQVNQVWEQLRDIGRIAARMNEDIEIKMAGLKLTVRASTRGADKLGNIIAKNLYNMCGWIADASEIADRLRKHEIRITSEFEHYLSYVESTYSQAGIDAIESIKKLYSEYVKFCKEEGKDPVKFIDFKAQDFVKQDVHKYKFFTGSKRIAGILDFFKGIGKKLKGMWDKFTKFLSTAFSQNKEYISELKDLEKRLSAIDISADDLHE